MNLLAGIVVVAFGVGLVGMAVVIGVRPELAARFLRSFASSARAHYTEQVLRLLVGTALVLRAPSMAFPLVFFTLGWLLVGTSAGLLLIPWQWHHRFARWVIPQVIRHRNLYALGNLALGGLTLYAVVSAVFA